MTSKLHFSIQLSDGAEKDFAKLDKSVQKMIQKKLAKLKTLDNPFVGAIKLQGMANRYRFRFGDYRVVFAVREDGTIVVLLVLEIQHRKDIYR